MDLSTLGILMLLLPLGGAIVAGTCGARWLKGATHWVVIAGVGGAAVCALMLLKRVSAEAAPQTLVIYKWFSSGALDFTINFRIDQLTAVMLVTVTFVATLVVIYARDYMRHHDHPERGYERFFAFLGLFVFSMLALVLSGNFLLLYFGWEAVGLCSYFLIGFYYPKPSAADAAKKAFLVNRIGDFGFGLGILLIYLKVGSLDYIDVFSPQGLTALSGYETVVSLLLLCGAVGKSAQIPLYVWLPDAMEGPSPVSALIHAATMVTAGVYMVARCGAIFAASDIAMHVVAYVGGVTALMAATIAVTQYDLKRILAYSTVSQLGYMFMALGVYKAGDAVFHLFTHAFFKALLFLAAGSVMHAMGGIIDVREFGGLRKVIPVTFTMFLVGAVALAGIPPLAGFYSKDLIIHAALEVDPVLGIIGLVTAALTAFYTFRALFLAFFGDRNVPDGVEAHESGVWMLVPLGVLAIGAIVTGFMFHHSLPQYLAPVLTPFSSRFDSVAHGWHVSHGAVGFISAALAFGGLAVAALLYVAWPELPGVIRAVGGRTYRVLYNKYYVDEAYDAAVVRPLWRGGGLLYGVDRFCVDGLVWVVSAIPRLIGFALRGLQQGSLQGYGVTMVTTFGLILFVFLYYSRQGM